MLGTWSPYFGPEIQLLSSLEAQLSILYLCTAFTNVYGFCVPSRLVLLHLLLLSVCFLFFFVACRFIGHLSGSSIAGSPIDDVFRSRTTHKCH